MSSSIEFPELPELVPTSIKSVRLESALTKRMPHMQSLSSYGNARQLEAEQYAREMGAVHEITRNQVKRSQKISKAKNRAAQRIAERKTKLRSS